jgi:hypothetical protein
MMQVEAEADYFIMTALLMKANAPFAHVQNNGRACSLEFFA